jgi:transposase-like protein
MDRTTPTSLYKWRDNWRNFGTQHPEMQVPLRLLRVGIEYLIKQDRKVLLDVVLVERQILEQALKIERQAADI